MSESVSLPKKPFWSRPAKFSFSTPTKTRSFILLSAIVLNACGTSANDINNATDREAMKVQIKLDLTNNDCAGALTIVTPLYNSSYSDNEIRNLYASAHACNVGIQLFQLLDDVSNASFTGADAIIREFVKLFPSTSADSRMASSWFAQDALQAMLNPGAVVAPADQINFASVNPASDSVNDRTLDSASYLLFVSMGVIGTTLNRYGYSSAQSAAALSYSQGQDLTWTTQAAVTGDTTGAACALVSGFFNLFDGIGAVVGLLSGATSSQLQLITGALQTGLATAGSLNCNADFPTPAGASQCAAAVQRIRYRGACAESTANASFAAGVIQAINAGWL